MTKPTDDLEAVRLVVAALEPFDSKDRDRIIRWAREKLGMRADTTSLPPPPPDRPEGSSVERVQSSADIKSFVDLKNPQSDTHLAATVAYYYHFQAPADGQKDHITKDDLVDACRKAERRRPGAPAQTLVNAFQAGLLDREGAGKYRLNSVGENLVAMVLPQGEGERPSVAPKKRSKRKKKAPPKKKGSKKKKAGKSRKAR